MRLIIEPLNESQSMNCRVNFRGTRGMAAKKASHIAKSLQKALAGTDISCRVRREESFSPIFIAFPDGQIIDETTGRSVTLQ